MQNRTKIVSNARTRNPLRHSPGVGALTILRGIAVAALCAGILGCMQPAPARSAEEAMARASRRIDALLARPPVSTIPVSDATPIGSAHSVELWYYAHPLLGRAFARPSADLNGVSLHTQFMGEWPTAIQKLMVSLAADTLPDVAMVKRELVPKLFDAGRIRALDTLLPKEFIDDLRSEARLDCQYKNHLVALPADGFCSLLFFNEDLIGKEPPRNWTYLTAFLNARKSDASHGKPSDFGYFPFMEASWSTGAEIFSGNHCRITSPEAMRALHFTIAMWGTPASTDSNSAFRAFCNGAVAMTVQRSDRISEATALRFPVGLAPVPGETGPISRRSNDALVVFARRDGASEASIASILNWLTGPEIMGKDAAVMGSVPLRRSAGAEESLPRGVLEAYTAAQNTPFHPEWGGIEMELNYGVFEAYRAVAKPS